MASRLFNRSTGKWMDGVPDSETTNLVANGSHAFESGIKVPVVAPDGKMGYIPSEDAESAFRDGYRWQTPDDKKANEQVQNEAILQKNFGTDNTLNAGTTGALRGYTMGLSDPLMIGIGALQGHGEDVQKALKETKDRNPIASTVGEIGGSLAGLGVGGGIGSKLANPLVKGGTEAARNFGERLVLGEVQNAAGNLVTGEAKNLAERVISKGVGSYAEGAFFGLGSGVSEAALGDPNEIAEHLMAGVTSGGLAGGVLGTGGAVLGEVASPLKDVISKVTSSANDKVKGAAQAAVRKTLSPTLSLQGEKEMAALVRDMTGEGSEAVRQAYYDGGPEAANRAKSAIQSAESEIQSAAKQTRSELEYEIKNKPKDLRNQINEDLQQFGGDVKGALDGTYQRYEGQRLSLESDLRLDQVPSQGSFFGDETQNLIKKFEKSGDPSAISKANDIVNFVKAQQVASTARTALGEPTFSEGRELLFANELRDRVSHGLDKLNGDARAVADNYLKNVTDALHEHPTYGQMFKDMDHTYDTFSTFRNFAAGKESTKVGSEVLSRIKTDPQFAKEFDVVLNNFGDVAPQIASYAKTGRSMTAESIATRQKALDQISDVIKSKTDRSFSSLTVDDLHAIAKEFSSPDMLQKVGQLRDLTGSLSAEGENVFTKAVRLQKALGKDVDPQFAKIASTPGMEEGFNKLSRLAPQQASEDYVKSLMNKLTRKTARTALAYAVGGPTGAAVMAGAEALGGVNTQHVLKGLTVLERQSNAAFQKIDAASKKAIDALTSKTGTRIGTIGVSQSAARQPLEKRRENFTKTSSYLTGLQNPEVRQQAIVDKFGDLPGAPKIQTAIATQFSKTADFLTSKLPTDPFGAQTLQGPFKSQWTPSDYELSRFERYQDAANDPTHTLTRLANGTVTPEEVETLQSLYPSIYKRLQEGVLNAIMDGKHELAYSQKVQLGTLLNISTDPSLTPSFIASMQSSFAPSDGSQTSPQGSNVKPGKLDMNIESTMTSVQKSSEA